ncbi:DUF551 domain-containing protein [Enterocloster citroniae]|uniref:DUF551 domain-containing protein n=2 Tax=Enterocloster citroniae TaxID=358743 RepID=A0ABV2G7M7_9FIRM|nr:DUF551 domain-containing protein [Enterocloster citroniae]KMW14139.1 hypothetical protein HMPREF9470_04901 [[Clostridium] citroniae WAL-19142]
MERLTDWINEEKTEVSIRHDRFRDAMIRLAAYEDTGLEPCEIPVLLDRLKRASEQWDIWCDAYQKDVPVWIPVAEQLPEAKEDVLVCTRDGWILTAWYGPHGESWHITPTDLNHPMKDINAWMPLPEPYRPEKLKFPGEPEEGKL